MAKKDKKEVRIEDAKDLIKAEREIVRKFRFNIRGGRVKNQKESLRARKQIARLLTMVNKKVVAK
ncbi:MAG: hypothetical protein HZA95_02835 [Candidatus Vogelbacteria bacterium]|nr:hypothetical protein [Candidatus Vogelbacteria bacterium]